jgi:hypothetical protein
MKSYSYITKIFTGSWGLHSFVVISYKDENQEGELSLELNK